MKIRTLQWNIGGGRVCNSDSDTRDPTSHAEDGIESIVDTLKEADADIITLQETHEGGGSCQPEIIANHLEYKYWLNHATDISFMDRSKFIGQGVISRFPITSSLFSPFTDPGFEVLNDGELIKNNKSGLTSCTVQLPGANQVQIKTFHMVPFHYFDVDLDDVRVRNVLRELGKRLTLDSEARAIVQADFNIDSASLTEYLPDLFAAGYQEVVQSEPTTPREKSLDHIVYKSLIIEGARVIRDCRTDHFPIVADFE